MQRSMEKLTDTAQTSEPWVPLDSYADVLIQSGTKFGQLTGVVSLMQYDMGACDGSIIQVQYIRPRNAQKRVGGTGDWRGAVEPCLSATSSTLGTQAVTIYKYGDYDQIPGFTEFEVCGPLRASIMEEMSRGIGRALDQEIWSALVNVVPNGTGGPVQTSQEVGKPSSFASGASWTSRARINSSSCCTYSYDLYNTIIRAQMHLRGDGLNPDYVIMHPTVAQHLYFREGGYYPNWDSTVKWDGNGVIKSINGMNVIECQQATAGVATSAATLAVIIDSSVAVAEAWGKRPTFSRDYVPECDYTKEVLWTYWGCAAISGASETSVANGIAHVINPGDVTVAGQA